MTSYSWKGGTGDWSTAANWTPGGPPTSADAVILSATGAAYTVSVTSSDAAGSLTLSSASATLSDAGAGAQLNITGALNMSAGVLNVATASVASGGLSVGGAFALSGGALNVNTGGVLTLSGQLTQTAGTINLIGGTISGGAIASTGGTDNWNAGTLSNVTIDGVLNLTSASTQQIIHMANGATVVGASGTGVGTINIQGNSSELIYDDGQTVSNETINIGTSGANDFLMSNDTTGAGVQLTFASSAAINVLGSAYIQAGSFADDAIVNQGQINQTAGQLFFQGRAFNNYGTISLSAAGGYAMVQTANFANAGLIQVSGGDKLILSASKFTTTASSVIAIGANSTVAISMTSPWSNLGSITLASGANLNINNGTVSAASLGSITNSGGAINLGQYATYANADDTLNGADFGALTLSGGTILGGVVTGAGVQFTTNGGTLNGVTFVGPLNLTSSSAQQTITLANGASVVGALGSGTGAINVTGFNSALHYANTQTIGDEVITIGNSINYDYVQSVDQMGGNQVLTLGASMQINAVGYAQIYDGGLSGDGIVNQGVITQSNGVLTITGASFTNAGTMNLLSSSAYYALIKSTNFTDTGLLNIGNDDTLLIESTNFSNYAAGTLTGGSYDISAYSTLEIYNAANLSTLSADVALTGLGSQIIVHNASTFVNSSLDTTLRTIGANGSLSLLGGRGWSIGAAVVNNGLLQLGGGAISVSGSGASLTNASGAELLGYGTLSGTVANAGIIEAVGGVLTLSNAVTGNGVLEIGANATLAVKGAIASGGAAMFVGDGATLSLATPSSFGATIGGISAGDAILLSGVTANSAKVNASNQLVIANGATTVATLQLDGAYANDYFLTVAVNGGTDVIALPTPATVAGYLGLIADYDLIPGGFTIQDTAGHIIANLATLGDSHINAISVTNGPLMASVANFKSYQTVLDKISGGYAISDTSAAIAASLDNLTDAKISAIVISDNAAIGVSVAQISNDATIIAKLVNGNASAAKLAVVDSGANILAGLANLNGANIASITISDNAMLAVNVAGATNNAVAIGKLVNANGTTGQVAVTDTAAHIAAGLASLITGHVASITISDNLTVALTSAAAVAADAAAIAKLVNANGLAYKISVTDTAAGISAALNSLNSTHMASIKISDNLAVAVNVTQLTSDAIAIGKLIDANAAPYQLVVTDTAANIVNGLPALKTRLAHIASINSTNGAPSVVAAKFVAYESALDKVVGGFKIADSAQNLLTNLSAINLDASVLAVTANSGGATLTSGSIAANALTLAGSGTSLTIAENFSYAGAVVVGSTTKLAVSAGDNVTLSNMKSNAGTIEVDGGLLDIGGALIGVGHDVISGAATLEFGASVGAGQTISFAGAGGAMELLNPQSFKGVISGFDLGGALADSLVIAAPWSYVKFAENTALTMGYLTLSNGSTTTTLTLAGNHTASGFSHAINSQGMTVITYA